MSGDAVRGGRGDRPDAHLEACVLAYRAIAGAPDAELADVPAEALAYLVHLDRAELVRPLATEELLCGVSAAVVARRYRIDRHAARRILNRALRSIESDLARVEPT